MKWSVSPDGYHWNAKFLTPIKETTVEYDVGAALFRRFIETPPTKEGVLAFANQYGLLYSSDQPVFEIDGAYIQKTSPHVETLVPWRFHILSMRAAVQVWDAVVKKKTRELKNRIKHEFFPSRRETIISYSWGDESPPGGINAMTPLAFKFGEIERPAKLWVMEVINGMLKAPPRQIHNPMRGAEVHLEITWDHNKQDGPVIAPASQSLIGELWLQFARVVTTGNQPRACQECGNWFISKPKRGPEQLFCSGACRTRAHRRKSK